MPWPEDIQTAIRQLSALRRELAETFTDRGEAVDVLALSAVCQEHTLLLGPPGTGKTELVARFTEALDAPLFSYLLTRFTEPSEIFGPLDLEAFQGGRYHIRTEGMLPGAAVAFLDEVFQGSSAILNTLLTLVHERVFHNGAERQPVPLITLVGASNELPTDTTLRAFSDRFALRAELAPVPDARLDELLDKGWLIELERMEAARRAARGARALPTLAEAAMRRLHERLPEVSVVAVRPLYGQILRELRAEGVSLSDRRMVKGLKLIAGAALMDNRTEAQVSDLWPLRHVWTTPEDAAVLRQIVDQHLDQHLGQHLAEGGALLASRRRSVDELRADLALLLGRAGSLRHPSAVGAHLMALGRLRREALLEHPDENPLHREIEAAIGQTMAALEDPHAHV
jgi:MoxR-like ATPase